MTYSLRQASDYLGLKSTRTLTKLCEKRLIDFILIGSRKRFTDAALDEYLESVTFHHRPNPSSPLASTR